MKMKIMAVTAAAACVLLLFSACGSGNNTSQTEQQSTSKTAETAEEAEVTEEVTKEPEVTEEVTEEPEVTEEVTEEPEVTEEVTEEPEVTEEVTEEPAEETDGTNFEYLWLGLSEMPKCNYVDLLASNHYIESYIAYTALGSSVMSVEEIYAVDGINSYKENEISRVYSVDGMMISINESQKIYSQMDMTDQAVDAKLKMEATIVSGTNYTGRAFVEKGTDTVPLLSEEGDDAEYEYYEFNYPEAEAYGTSTTERFYMKDGDVYAIYTNSTMGETEVEMTKVIKGISGDIPEGTFELPDLTGYELYEI